MTYKSIVISSGHGKYVRGAHGIIDEVDEARKVVDHVADELEARGVDVTIFHDNTSQSQNENLNTIVNFHNNVVRDIDVSVHFNAFEQREQPVGCEVLYLSQAELAGQVSSAIAKCGFINRGAKKRTDLFFLNKTEMPAILLEVCFVDSQADTDIYKKQFSMICDAIANALGGKEGSAPTPPEPASLPRVDIEISGEALIYVNGVLISTKG
jgi:N-acetylmuramoyl-L-alanine amidase